MPILKAHVGLDSNCLTYLLTAISGISEPTDDLALEKIALIRIWFHKPGNFCFYLTETVVSEVKNIPDSKHRELHDSFIRTLFCDYPVQDVDTVQQRAAYFQNLHNKQNDCRVLAEAEELGLDILLTYDNDFWKKLKCASNKTRLMKPSEYWASLGIPRGANPITVPHSTNPLSQENWWRWK